MKNDKPANDTHFDSLGFLSETAIQFASSGINHKIYSFIGQCLMKLNPEAIIIVNSIDLENGFLRIEEFMTPGQKLDKIISLLGFNPIGKIIKVDDSILELTTGAIQKFQHGIHELSFKSIPGSISKLVEKVLNIGDIYGIGFMIDKRIFANASIMLQKGDELAHTEIIETFVRQASVTLKRIEAEKNEEKYRSLFEFMTDGAFYQDANGKFLDVNASALNLFGLTREEFFNKNQQHQDWKLVDEHLKPLPANEFLGSVALKTGKPVYNATFGVFNPLKNDFVWIITNAIPQFLPDVKTPYRVFVTMHDISEQRQKDEALRESEVKYRILFQNSPDAYLIIVDGVFVDCNRAAETMLRGKREEILGKSPANISPEFQPDGRKSIDVAATLTEQSFRNGQNIFEWVHRRLDGSDVFVEVNLTTMTLNGKKALFNAWRDITDRKQLEAELRKSEEKFKAVADTSPLAIYLSTGIEEKALYINPTFTMLFGYTIDEVPSAEHWWPKAYPNENYRRQIVEEWQRKVEHAIQTQSGIEPLEAEVTCKDGSKKNIQWGFKTIGKQNWSFGLDLTERKRAEEAFRESEQRFRDNLENVNLISAILDIDGNISFANNYFLKLTGWQFEEVLGRNWFELFVPPEIELREILFKDINKGSVPTYYQNEILTRTGDRRLIDWSNTVLRDTHGNITGIAGIGIDITERKRDQEALMKSEEKYRILTENMKDVVWLLDTTSFRFLYISPSVTKLRGYTPEEIIAEPMDAALTQENSVQFRKFIHQHTENLLVGKASFDTFFTEEVEQPCKNGSTVWTEVITKFILNEKTGVVELLGVTRDITERKKAEQEIKLKNEELLKLNAEKDKFFSIIAHDLKSPFNAILGFSEMLKDEARDLDIGSIIQYAGIINSASQNAFDLLENLLDWARMQQGKIPYEPVTLLLNTIIHSEFEVLKINADQKNISLVDGIHENIILTADENMLRTIIRNLVSNAIKFTPKGGQVKIEVEGKVEVEGRQVVISVSDTGIGMKPETIEKLFKIETSFTTRGTENEKGTGLGLLLCKEFVEKHGGRIWVESEQGKGSVFYLQLKIK